MNNRTFSLILIIAGGYLLLKGQGINAGSGPGASSSSNPFTNFLSNLGAGASGTPAPGSTADLNNQIAGDQAVLNTLSGDTSPATNGVDTSNPENTGD